MRKGSFFAIALATLVAACDSDPSSTDPNVQVSFEGLERLEGGFHYEGWLIIDGAPVTTGKFNVSSSGDLETLSGSAIASGGFAVDAAVDNATAFVLTIEPAGDVDTVPAATKYLGGDLSAGTATLSAAHGSSLGDDHLSASGTYILATPTDGPDSDELSGVWFLDPSSGTPQAGLSLPALPTGWIYEGWAVIDGQPVTTGRFSSGSAADDFAGFSGPNAGPPFPGEDFLTGAPAGLTFPVDLSGGTAVISIEPVPDDSPAPFALKPLVGQVPSAAAAFTPYQMANNAGSFPTGTVVIR